MEKVFLPSKEGPLFACAFWLLHVYRSKYMLGGRKVRQLHWLPYVSSLLSSAENFVEQANLRNRIIPPPHPFFLANPSTVVFNQCRREAFLRKIGEVQ